MTIATQRSTLYRTLLLLGLSSLVACGGGGGGGGTTPGTSSKAAESSLSSNVASSVLSGVASSIVATSSSSSSSSSSVLVVDTSPAVFNFAPTTDVALSTAITSPAITLSGFDVAVPISITNGEYSINGGAFTSAAGTISPAQTLVVKVTSSNTNSTAVTTTLTVGGVSATYTVTTLADAIPDAFSFTPATNVEPESTSTSNAITVSGIEVATAISITGGEYSINGGAFTSVAGTVTNGQTVAVKAVAPAGTELTQNAVVTIGGVSGTYAVTTVPDTTPPVAEFKFPTPYTMSEAMTVKVRGTATDENAISSVKVVVRSFDLDAPDVTLETDEIDVTPTAEIDGVKDFSSWTVEVPLTALAENEIKVVAMDDRNNVTVINDANKVVIRQADVANAFPDDVNQFGDASGGIVIDKVNGRNRILVADSYDAKIHSVSIATGERSVYKDLSSENIELVWGMVIDDTAAEPVLYAHAYNEGKILKINLADGTTISSYQSDLYQQQRGLVLEEKDGVKKLVSINPGDLDRNSDVISFNLQTEAFSTIFSDVNYSLLPSTWGFALDKSRNRYLVTVRNRASNLYGIYSIDRTTGERQPFSTNEVGAGELFIDRTALQDIAMDEEKNIMYVPDYKTGKLFAIELNTGDRRVVADLSYENVNGDMINPSLSSIQIDSSEQIAYVGDSESNSLRIVDLMTSAKVFLSKSKNDD